MIICSCNNINDKKLTRVKAAGAKSPCVAYRMLGCEIKCGQCCKEVADFLKN